MVNLTTQGYWPFDARQGFNLLVKKQHCLGAVAAPVVAGTVACQGKRWTKGLVIRQTSVYGGIQLKTSLLKLSVALLFLKLLRLVFKPM